MKNRAGNIIYVGKSRNLRRRVSSYFSPHSLTDPKIARIHEQLHSIDVFTTENEIEALLMELRMIKDMRPPINLQTEIHEKQAYYGKGRNLLFFVVDEGENIVQIYFLLNGIFVGQHSAILGSPPSKRLRAKLKFLFFPRRPRRRRQVDIWKKEIVRRWLAANRKHLNYLDVDQAGDFKSALGLLRDYLRDPDRLTSKVCYRTAADAHPDDS